MSMVFLSAKVYNTQISDNHKIIYDVFRKIVDKIQEKYTLHSFFWLTGYDETYKNQINFHLKINEEDNEKIKEILKEFLSSYSINFTETSEKDNSGDENTLGSNCKNLLSDFLYPCCKLALERTNPANKEFFNKDLNIEKFIHCFLNSQGLTYQEEIIFCINYASAIHKMLYNQK